MNNSTMASGVGSAISQLHTLVSLTPSLEDFPPLPVPAYACPPAFWTTSCSLSTDTRQSLRIIPVIGDGSCSGGAVTTVIVNTDLLSPSDTDSRAPLSQRLVPLRQSHRPETDFFRTQLHDYVSKLTPEEWERHVPTGGDLAILIVDDARCWRKSPTHCAGCGVTDAKEAFLYICARPTHWSSPAFFHLAAAFLQTGILVLMHDHRHSQFDLSPPYVVYDFGTDEYPQSMILLAHVEKVAPKQLQSSSHSSSSGHYTTVCRQPDTDILAGQLLFSCSSPVLTSLRVMARHRDTATTVSHQRVQYQHYRRVAPSVGCIVPPSSLASPSPAAAAAGPASPMLVDATSELSGSVRASDRHGLRPPHARRPPQKLAEQNDVVSPVVSALARAGLCGYHRR